MENVSVVDLHHEVLPCWAEVRKTLPAPPGVWTLDFHTDSMPCFRGAAPDPHPGAWRDPEAMQKALSALRHDEHVDWALKAGLIGRWEVLSYASPALAPAQKPMCCHVPAGFPELSVILNDPEAFRRQAESVLETPFLSEGFGAHLPDGDEPYVLDIDCDYFLTEKALFPQDETLFDSLVRHAAAVTISRENDWVRLLKLRGETITGDGIAEILGQKIRKLREQA